MRLLSLAHLRLLKQAFVPAVRAGFAGPRKSTPQGEGVWRPTLPGLPSPRFANG